MLGYVLYESIEVVYYISKIAYNSVSSTYNWYYNINNKPYDNTIKMIEIEKQLLLLNNKCNELEQKLYVQDKINAINKNNLTNSNNQLLLTYNN